MKKVTFGMLTITFLMFLGLLATSDVGFAKIESVSGEERNSYLNIMTANKMEYYMVKDIVGNKHNVEYLFNSEKESNSFEITSDVINNISNMDLFYYTGLSYEKWSDDLINDVDKTNLGIIDLSRGIKVISDNDNNNCYYLAGASEYKIALYNIKNSVQDKDPLNRQYYEDNYNKTIRKLDSAISNIETNSKNKDYDKYTFIAIDKDLDYFYKNLDIDVKYVEPGKLDKFIKDKRIEKSNVIILMNQNNQFDNKSQYKVIELNKYSTKNAKDMIIENYKKIYYGGYY